MPRVTEIMTPKAMVTFDKDELDMFKRQLGRRVVDCHKHWKKTKSAKALQEMLEASYSIERLVTQLSGEDSKVVKEVLSLCKKVLRKNPKAKLS
jgi:hypothetical protein